VVIPSFHLFSPLERLWRRAGHNRPPFLSANDSSLKGCDGIRETTWPSVYNRSRIPGRNDYFQYPDWNCYSLSGKSISFTLPEEPWNHIEISGAAFGKASYIAYDPEHSTTGETVIFDRPRNQERTFHRLAEPLTGGKIRFDNTEQKTPIGEFMAYYVVPGTAPEGKISLTYTVTAAADPGLYPILDPLLSYMRGRFTEDERTVAVALPNGAPRMERKNAITRGLPIVHILIPDDFRVEQPGV
jgi:hypothetical protein